MERQAARQSRRIGPILDSPSDWSIFTKIRLLIDLLRTFEQFPDQESCIAHLEQIRWPEQAPCPLCGGFKVARKSENCRIDRWNCYNCGSSFNVLSGTILLKREVGLLQFVLLQFLLSV